MPPRQFAVGRTSGALAAGACRGVSLLVTDVCEFDCPPFEALALPPVALPPVAVWDCCCPWDWLLFALDVELDAAFEELFAAEAAEFVFVLTLLLVEVDCEGGVGVGGGVGGVGGFGGCGLIQAGFACACDKTTAAIENVSANKHSAKIFFMLPPSPLMRPSLLRLRRFSLSTPAASYENSTQPPSGEGSWAIV